MQIVDKYKFNINNGKEELELVTSYVLEGERGGKYGVMDRGENVLADYIYDYIEPFTEKMWHPWSGSIIFYSWCAIYD